MPICKVGGPTSSRFNRGEIEPPTLGFIVYNVCYV